MPIPMPNDREWLEAEQSAQEEFAEVAFARLVAEMPLIEPGGDFVSRVVQAAWRARARRRLVTRLSWVVAVLLAGFVTFGLVYALGSSVTALIVRAAVVFSHGLTSFLTLASQEAKWWWMPERIGTAVSDAIAAPFMAAILAAVEMIGLLVIYAFRRLVHEQLETHESRKVQI